MNNTNKKFIGFWVGVSMLLLGAVSVQAEPSTKQSVVTSKATLTGDIDPNQTSTCLSLQSTLLRYKATDQMTNGEVSTLQDFLISVGFLKTQATGYFGLGTFSAVKQFQKSVGLSSSGYVGPVTKAKIKEMSCSTSVSDQPTQKSVPYYFNINSDPLVAPGVKKSTSTTSDQGMMVGCAQMDYRACPNGAPMKRDPISCQFIESSCDTLSPVAPRASSTGEGIKRKILEIYSQPIVPGTTTRISPSLPQVVCTMEVKLCPDGITAMARDERCGWHPESCPATSSQTGMQCTQDSPTAKAFCGPQPVSAPIY
jgi:hypothetical protein